MADLEIVRKVRALLEELQLGSSGSSPLSVPQPAVAVMAATPVFTTKAPERPREEVLKECLAATGGRPFAPQDF
ncbi:MAG: hypothetical protein IPK32_02710 [Verrucomicrobiaceae bacterium]|nr:hypothetical protein [Verrucomicrobiaceae bacterium]